MLVLLAFPVVLIVAGLHRYLATFAPTNVLVRSVRSQEPRWRTIFMLAALAAAMLATMHLLAGAIARGAPGWLNLVVLLLAWDAIKVGALSGILTIRRGLVQVHRGPS